VYQAYTRSGRKVDRSWWMIQFHWEQLTRRVREVVIYLCIAICSLSSSYPFSFVLGPMEHVRISSVADISFLLVPSCGNHVRQVRNLGVTYQWKMEMRDSNTRHRFLRVVHPCGCYYFKSFCFDPDSFLVAPRVCWKRASFHSNSRVPSMFLYQDSGRDDHRSVPVRVHL